MYWLIQVQDYPCATWIYEDGELSVRNANTFKVPREVPSPKRTRQSFLEYQPTLMNPKNSRPDRSRQPQNQPLRLPHFRLSILDGSVSK